MFFISTRVRQLFSFFSNFRKIFVGPSKVRLRKSIFYLIYDLIFAVGSYFMVSYMTNSPDGIFLTILFAFLLVFAAFGILTTAIFNVTIFIASIKGLIVEEGKLKDVFALILSVISIAVVLVTIVFIIQLL